MKLIIKIFVLCFLCCSVFVVNAQKKANISGKIRDSISQESLYLAEVAVVNLEKPIRATSSSRGNFSLEVPSNTLLQVRVSSVGYVTQTDTFTLQPGEKKDLLYLLVPSSRNLKEVEVEAQRNKSENIVRLDPKGFNELVGPSTSAERLIILTQPGVVSQNELSSQYSVRGGNFDENLVYINDIEIYRPLLVRTAEQEGLSIINPDMVGNIEFSAGGFDAVYGDKISSVLDITYRKPTKFGGKVTGSFLGFTAYVEGLVKDRFTFNVGFRQQSNQYILQAMQTEGSYRPSFTDLQTYFTYKISPKADVSFLGVFSRNFYKMIPESRTTEFGPFSERMKLKVAFDGQEIDEFRTLLGAATLNYHPFEKTLLKFIVSGFGTHETELYDIQGQYWLYELEDPSGNSTQKTELDRGVGTYLEHARNYLTGSVYSFEHKGTQFVDNGSWNWGVKYQHEIINDRMREWTMIDSAGYTVPSFIINSPGDSNAPVPPFLQDVYKSVNDIASNRISGYVQKHWLFNFDTNIFKLNAGIRFQYWDFNNQFLLSPRVNVSYKPHWSRYVLFRLATGVYSQSPFYREYRDQKGVLYNNIKAQTSYQVVGSSDIEFKMLNNRPFKFVTEVYYKYLTNIIPYQIDNMRIRYSPEKSAVGYAAGIDLRLNGEFIEGIESYASMTLMQTQEDIAGDNYGYLARPTDQRFMFKLFFQDYIPTLPWVRMSLNFIYGTGLPFTRPQQDDFTETNRLPGYLRVDWGTSFKLKGKDSKWAQKNVFKYLEEVWLYFDIFNIFQSQNVASYIWVADYEGRYYGVPNYLTPRQINVKLTVSF